MIDGVPVARLFGIVIRVHWSWVLILALVAAIGAAEVRGRAPELLAPLEWIVGGLVAAGFLASATAHDLAHALVSRRRGLRVESLAVSFFGGASPLEPSARTAADELAIAAAGPVASLAAGLGLLGLALVGLSLGGPSNPVVEATGILGVVLGMLNVLLGLVNLVPAYPLDGGRLLRAFVWARTGNERRGTELAGRSGSAIGIALMLGGAVVALAQQNIGNGILVLLSGWFLRLTARSALQRVELEALADGLRVGDVMEPLPTAIAPGLTVDTFADQLLEGDPPRTAVLVARGTEVVGLVGLAQIRRLRRSAWATTRAEDIMVPASDLPDLPPDAPVWPALLQLRLAGLDGAPVTGTDGHAGLLTVRGIIAAIQARRPAGGAGGLGMLL